MAFIKILRLVLAFRLYAIGFIKGLTVNQRWFTLCSQHVKPHLATNLFTVLGLNYPPEARELRKLLCMCRRQGELQYVGLFFDDLGLPKLGKPLVSIIGC